MHHLSPMLRREGPVTGRSSGCQDLVRFFALLRIKPHAPPLVRVPVNSFEFHSCERTPQVECLMRLRRHRRALLPTLSSLNVSHRPVSRLRHWCSSQYLRISPLHWEFHLPLRHSSCIVSKAVPGLSPGLSLQTYTAVYAPFTPSKSG